MRLRPRRVLLDTNAVGSLYEPRQERSAEDLAVFRDLLADRVRNGSVQVVIAYRLLEEYAPVQRSDPARYAAVGGGDRGLAGASSGSAEAERLIHAVRGHG
jgi:hypothetical protein